MEYINKIELQGNISSPSFADIHGKKVARFSLATVFAYDAGKEHIIETTWFPCIAFEDDGIDVSVIQSNKTLNVTGRLKENRYITSDGSERRIFEVICRTVKPVE